MIHINKSISIMKIIALNIMTIPLKIILLTLCGIHVSLSSIITPAYLGLSVTINIGYHFNTCFINYIYYIIMYEINILYIEPPIYKL